MTLTIAMTACALAWVHTLTRHNTEKTRISKVWFDRHEFVGVTTDLPTITEVCATRVLAHRVLEDATRMWK